MKKGSVSINLIISLVLTIVVISGGVYLYLRSPKQTLAEAKIKVAEETKKLDELHERYDAEREVIKQLQAKYTALRNDVINKMDYFFTNPNSANPKIIIKLNDKAQEEEINKRRLEITKILDAWDKKMAQLTSDSISPDSLPSLKSIVLEAKDNIKYVETYIKELGEIVENLDPSNSQLQQTQIYTFQSIIETSVNNLAEITSNFDSIEVAVEQIYTPIIASNTGVSSSDSNTSSNSSSVSSGSSSEQSNNNSSQASSNTPIVTQPQITAQETALAQAQAEQAKIEQSQNIPITPYTPYEPPTVIYITGSYTNSYQRGSQTVLEYLHSLPNANTDHTGWPDRSVDDGTGKPLLLDGSN